MLYCDFCKVELPGVQNRCPLCHSTPAGEPDVTCNPYPVVPESRKTLSRTLVIWGAFTGICIIAVCAGINIIIPEHGWWSLFVAAGVASFWIDFTFLLKKRKNLPKNVIWQAALISIIALIWDSVTGYRGWSLGFVLPIISTVAMLILVVIANVRKLDIQDYIFYLVIACILGIISFVLILTGVVQIIIPSVISFVSAVIFMAFLLFFEGRALWAEFQRRMHM